MIQFKRVENEKHFFMISKSDIKKYNYLFHVGLWNSESEYKENSILKTYIL